MTAARFAAGILAVLAGSVLLITTTWLWDWWTRRRNHCCALCDALATRPSLLGPFTQAEIDTLRAYEHELTGVSR